MKLDYRNDVPLHSITLAETRVLHRAKHTKVLWRFCEYTWRHDNKTVYSFTHLCKQLKNKRRNTVMWNKYERQARLYEREVFGHNPNITRLM